MSATEPCMSCFNGQVSKANAQRLNGQLEVRKTQAKLEDLPVESDEAESAVCKAENTNLKTTKSHESIVRSELGLSSDRGAMVR